MANYKLIFEILRGKTKLKSIEFVPPEKKIEDPSFWKGKKKLSTTKKQSKKQK